MENDKNVKVIWINVFSGLLLADKVAYNVLFNVKHGVLTKPTVLRLHGNGIEEANKTLSKLPKDCNVTIE